MTLLVLRLVATKEKFVHLMSCLFEAAKEAGASKVEIWNLSPSLLEGTAQLRCTYLWRDKLLNCFKWYASESNSEVVWLNNERFSCDWTRVLADSADSSKDSRPLVQVVDATDGKQKHHSSYALTLRSGNGAYSLTHWLRQHRNEVPMPNHVM